MKKIGNEKTRVDIYNKVDTLQEWPSIHNVKALRGRAGYRLRAGKYRVIFDVRQSLKIIEIGEVRKRDERTY